MLSDDDRRMLWRDCRDKILEISQDNLKLGYKIRDNEARLVSLERVKDSLMTPCSFCDGNGSYSCYDDYDSRDTVVCEPCKGTGEKR